MVPLNAQASRYGAESTHLHRQPVRNERASFISLGGKTRRGWRSGVPLGPDIHAKENAAAATGLRQLDQPRQAGPERTARRAGAYLDEQLREG